MNKNLPPTPRIAFVTNFCTHYVIKLFEKLSVTYQIKFLFTGGYETYWDKKNKMRTGHFDGKNLKGFVFLGRYKISFGLFSLFSSDFDIYVKTIDDRLAMLITFLAAKLKRKPFILWAGLWHHPQTWFHRLTFGLTKYIYQHSDAIITYGDHVKKYLVDLGVSEKKIFIAPHSVDNSIFNKPVSKIERMNLRKQLRIDENPVIIYVGRLEECKGVDFLLEALMGITTVKLNVLFVGSGANREKYERECQQLSAKCYFLDHIPNEQLYRYYNISDIFVLPSITTKNFKEPWGLVVNEAMNQGCVVVATNAVGAAVGGLVEDGHTGFIVPERDAENLKNAFLKLLNDESKMKRMSQSAKDKMKIWNTEKQFEGFCQAIEYV